MHRLTWMIVALGATAVGQTQVDLRTQSKAVDFSSAISTKPVTTGTLLPANCTVGQMFFLTTAPAGQNLYGCLATNIWNLETGSGSGSVTVENAGTVAGTNPTLNFTAGAGILYAISNSGSAITVQTSSNTAVTPTLVSDQANGVRLCTSASGSATAYSCALNPTLTGYTTGMILDWVPDVTATGGVTTLNVDTLGATAITLPDGATNPMPGDIVAGRMSQIWYDGTKFRLLTAIVPAGVLGDAQPTCSSAVRGRLWFVAGGTSVKDSLTVCAKDATDAYAWRTLY